jgi:3-keto-L-gulonate-6-phosphate decarboxylase
MKYYILLDHFEYEKNVKVAHLLHDQSDGFVMGSLFLARYGIEVVDKLRKEFPRKMLYVETRIVDRPREMVSLACQNGADWVSVMGGSRKEVIHSAASKAHDIGRKIFLDLLTTPFSGQVALEAASLGVDALLFTYFSKQNDKDLTEQWQMVQGNTNLPIFFSGIIDRSLIILLQEIRPFALILGKVITEHDTPELELQFFKESLL